MDHHMTGSRNRDGPFGQLPATHRTSKRAQRVDLEEDLSSATGSSPGTPDETQERKDEDSESSLERTEPPDKRRPEEHQDSPGPSHRV